MYTWYIVLGVICFYFGLFAGALLAAAKHSDEGAAAVSEPAGYRHCNVS